MSSKYKKVANPTIRHNYFLVGEGGQGQKKRKHRPDPKFFNPPAKRVKTLDESEPKSKPEERKFKRPAKFDRLHKEGSPDKRTKSQQETDEKEQAEREKKAKFEGMCVTARRVVARLTRKVAFKQSFSNAFVLIRSRTRFSWNT